MGGLCSPNTADAGLVYGLVQAMDCNVQSLVQAGYGALSRNGSPVMTALTILLTIYVGLTGFELMVGRTPLRVGDVTMNVLKIGAILAFTTSWATYQEIVLNTLVHGPDQIGALILHGLDPSDTGVASDPYSALQAAYDELQRAALFFSQRGVPVVSPLQGGTAFAAFAINISSLLLIMTTLGVILTAKIVLALLLALGPIFAGFLLFDSTRGLFHGWLRATIACAFVPLLGILSLVVQLEFLGPQLGELADAMDRNAVDLAPPTAIFVLSLVFGLVSTALIVAVGVIGLSFRKSGQRIGAVGASRSGRTETGIPPASVSAMAAPANFASQDRVTQIAGAAAAMSRRESRAAEVRSMPHVMAAIEIGASSPGLAAGGGTAQGRRRSAQPRRSARNLRRDA